MTRGRTAFGVQRAACCQLLFVVVAAAADDDDAVVESAERCWCESMTLGVGGAEYK